MIELRGKISVQRLSGSINVVPTSGSPPLQGKVVIPNHEEQLIKPDDEYYGLSVVTVAAVPRLPCVEMSAVYENEIRYGRTIDLGIRMTATSPEAADLYYHNYEQFPEIPADLKTSFPYAIIVGHGSTIRLYMSREPFYYSVSDYKYIKSQSGVGNIRCTFYPAVNQWVLDSTSTEWSLQISNIWSVDPPYLLWSNHDIPNGSPEATEIYFLASVPTADQPTSVPTHYYYAGIRLPDIFTVISEETHPYQMIVEHIDTGAFYAIGTTSLSNYRKDQLAVGQLQLGGGRVVYLYDKDADAWVASSVSSTLYMDDYAMRWTSATLTASGSQLYLGNTWGYPMPPVPNPV